MSFLKLLKIAREFTKTTFKKRNFGYCNICESKTLFIEKTPWLRENYKCLKCGSSPRQRSLINGLNLYYPDWKNLNIHESSPSTASSVYIKKYCKNYSASHFYQDIPPGQYKGEYRSEDLSNMTFGDQSFDIILSQDVFEHVMDPINAFREIARVLKKGGAHIFTLGWSPNTKISEPRSIIKNGEVLHLKEPQYHGNPIDEKGSLVTWDWGIDIAEIIFKESGLITSIYDVHNRFLGLDGETIEVLVSRKI